MAFQPRSLNSSNLLPNFALAGRICDKSKWIIVKVNVDYFELINVKLNNHVNIIPTFAAQLGDEYAIRGNA